MQVAVEQCLAHMAEEVNKANVPRLARGLEQFDKYRKIKNLNDGMVLYRGTGKRPKSALEKRKKNKKKK